MSELASMATAQSLLPDGYDFTVEEEFIQAGQVLVEIGRKALIALGELLAWKVARERATDQGSRDAIINRYASEWGVSRSNLYKALVTASRFPEVARPQDVAPTAQYEILSGSESIDDAEAGMQALTENGWGVRQAREAKALRAKGLTQVWHIPQLYFVDGWIMARASDGREVRVMRASDEDDDLVRQAVALVRYRTGT